MANDERVKELADLARELDEMERDVSPWEADFLASVLPVLRDGGGVSPKQERVLREMAERYLDGEAPEPIQDRESE